MTMMWLVVGVVGHSINQLFSLQSIEPLCRYRYSVVYHADTPTTRQAKRNHDSATLSPAHRNNLLVGANCWPALAIAAALLTRRTTLCRCVAVSQCRCVAVSLCRCVAVSLCRCVAVLRCRFVAVSLCRCVAVSLCLHCVAVSLCRCVTVSLCRTLRNAVLCVEMFLVY